MDIDGRWNLYIRLHEAVLYIRMLLQYYSEVLRHPPHVHTNSTFGGRWEVHIHFIIRLQSHYRYRDHLFLSVHSRSIDLICIYSITDRWRTSAFIVLP